MKKKISILSVVLLILLVVTFLVGCEPVSYYFKYDELKEDIVKVELITYDYPNPQGVKDESEILPFDFDRMKVVSTLQEEKFDDFFRDLSGLQFHDYRKKAFISNTVAGTGLKMTCENGDFIVVFLHKTTKKFHGGVRKFDSSGNLKEYILIGKLQANTFNLVNNGKLEKIFYKYF